MLQFAVLLLVAPTFTHAQKDVDGAWNSWMSWTTCSVTCGHGVHVRSRICDNPQPEGKGVNCTGSDYDVKPCDMVHCPVDGQWSSWDGWHGCTVSCGTGVTFRIRNCTDPKPAYNGSDCVGDRQEFSKCVEIPCPVDGGWTNWASWAECSGTCGYNIYRPRFRNCSNPEPQYGGANCTGDEMDQELCEYVDCKDGVWREWAPWGDCSATCGTSIHFRFRNCSFSAFNGSCVGDEYESGLCSSFCPVDGKWSDWQAWATCSATCEKGTTHRVRLCANPVPAHGGQNCTGKDSETKSCTNPTPCPIDGEWTSWTNWTDCDKSCGNGHQVRIRRCANPPPLYNGKPCSGKDIESQVCNTNPCPVDGGWSAWTTWLECSTTCGSGVKSRFRVCDSPRPQYSGAFCDGEFEENTNCTISPDLTNCTIDGEWGSWGAWSSCDVTCGDGQVVRSRQCNNPVPHGEGKYCEGENTTMAACSVPSPCPVNGDWSGWRNWFPCSVTCGNGTRSRLRTCSNPKPQYGGDYCSGENEQSEDCSSGVDCSDVDPLMVG